MNEHLSPDNGFFRYQREVGTGYAAFGSGDPFLYSFFKQISILEDPWGFPAVIAELTLIRI